MIEVENWKKPGGGKPPEKIQKQAEELLTKVDEQCKKFANPNQCGERAAALGNAGPPLTFVPPPITQRITQLLDLKVPEGLLGKLSLLPRLLEIAKFPPRMKGGTPPSQEIVWRGDEIVEGMDPDQLFGDLAEQPQQAAEDIIDTLDAADLRIVCWELAELLAKVWPAANKPHLPLDALRANVEESVARGLDKAQ